MRAMRLTKAYATTALEFISENIHRIRVPEWRDINELAKVIGESQDPLILVIDDPEEGPDIAAIIWYSPHAPGNNKHIETAHFLLARKHNRYASKLMHVWINFERATMPQRKIICVEGDGFNWTHRWLQKQPQGKMWIIPDGTVNEATGRVTDYWCYVIHMQGRDTMPDNTDVDWKGSDGFQEKSNITVDSIRSAGSDETKAARSSTDPARADQCNVRNGERSLRQRLLRLKHTLRRLWPGRR